MKYFIISAISMFITTQVVAVVADGSDKEPNPFQWIIDQRNASEAARAKLGAKFDYPESHRLYKNLHREGYEKNLRISRW